MADVKTQGYQCEFVDSVPDDYYCKKCKLIAKDLTVCTSCMESYCSTCITDTQKQGHPCPTCGEKHFQTLAHVKYQKRMRELKVYCNLKKRGCDWSGTLEQLDTHLDPDKDNCQYVDTKCPLHCEQTVPKNKVEQHVSEECVKRDYFCQYCSFNATYEEVVDKHLPKCTKVILPCRKKCRNEFECEGTKDHKTSYAKKAVRPCPNKCRNEFGCEGTKDHKISYALESFECKLNVVGCDEGFRSKNQGEHTTQKSCKHPVEQVQQTIEKQEKKHKDKNTFSMKKANEERKALEKKEKVHKKIIKKHERKTEDQGSIIEKLRLTKLEKKQQKHEKLEDLKLPLLELSPKNMALRIFRAILNEPVKHEFIIQNYSQEMKKEISSQAMYTHNHQLGYKFFTHVYISARNFLCVVLFTEPGVFDDQLQWPARVKVCTQLLNQDKREDIEVTQPLTWNRPNEKARICGTFSLRDASQLDNYLVRDTLHFRITVSQYHLNN